MTWATKGLDAAEPIPMKNRYLVIAPRGNAYLAMCGSLETSPFDKITALGIFLFSEKP